ncbi:DUF3048 domain-containing protein [Kitasatospora sp. NBC_01287]|uniref:DUF3048 domain-containing protein n=1 Tax=Kitasatospora sp. NBC_01287 TaxID=2903573 RepID=UPI00224CF779|nr:DUF3048 domain-containing protein [Kitasatospora sp. NBC_01287]MCX4751651.1 DUF3048 domain-containing protein [Kitasatospora sp. NBC_01287]
MPSVSRRSVAAPAAAVFALLLIGVGGCGGGSPTAHSSPTTTPAPSSGAASGPASGPASSAPSSTPSPSPTAQVSPLTGLPGEAGRIVAVKIDNIVNARPQTGINSADVVYAIEVEGGLSRFLAVYDGNNLPPGGAVGPVRSARESDLPILQQYGKVAFAYSGALSKFLPVLAQADIFNASPQQDAGPYFRGTSKVAPFNLYVKPAQVLHDFPDSAQAKDIGFRFGPAPDGGTPTNSFTAKMPAASFTFNWDATQGKYLVTMDGRAAMTTDAGQMGAPTIVVQKVAETTSPRGFMDSPGVPSPYAPTVGSGDAVILRDGKAYQGSWSRTDPNGGTTYSYAGQPMNFHPGQVWVVLEPQ